VSGAKPAARAQAERPRHAPTRAYVEEEERAKQGTPVLRSLLGWVFALAALAALAYLANAVFTRPDPRKTRRASDPTLQTSPQ
jgi:hypothetical protein